MSGETQEVPAGYSTQKDLIGEALAREIAAQLPNSPLGVMINVFAEFDPDTFADILADEVQFNTGVVLSGIDEADIPALQAQVNESSSLRITDEISTAIKWRHGDENEFSWNGTNEPDRIVVIVRGNPARLGSLHRLDTLTLGNVRQRIVSMMLDRPEFRGNTPSEELWNALGDDLGDRFDVTSVAEYALDVTGRERQEAIEQLEQSLYLLGLFPDPGLLNDADEVANRLAENLDHVSRVNNMSNKDEQRLTNSIHQTEGDDSQDRARTVEKIRRLQRTGDQDLLADLEFSQVQEVFEASASGGGGGGRQRRNRSTSSASIDLMLQSEDDDLEELADRLDSEIERAMEEDEDRAELDFGDDEKIVADIDKDLFYFVEYFITEETYGGIIEGAEDLDDGIDNFRALDVSRFEIEDDDSSFGRIRNLADRYDDLEPIIDALEDYKEKREDLLETAFRGLVFGPLLSLGDNEFFDATWEYLEAYREMQKIIDNKYRRIQDISSHGAPELLSEFLLLDTIVIHTDDGIELLLSPLHPLHVWRYAKLARQVFEERDSLTEEEQEFLLDAIEEHPHVLRSIDLSGNRYLPSTHLIQSKERGHLPVYSEAGTAEEGSNANFWKPLLRKLSIAYPPAQRRLHISVIDPIRPVELLDRVETLVENGTINGCLVEFAFINTEKSSILEDASSDQEEKITSLFGADTDTESFRIRMYDEAQSYEEYADYLEEYPKHVVVVNDQSVPEVDEFERDRDLAIHPLYVPKEFEYDEWDGEIKIRPSTEGELFSEYQNLVNQLNNQRQDLHNAGVHELSIKEETVEHLLDQSIWTCLSVPSTNIDPFWRSNLISREHHADRDYAIYSTDQQYFVRVIQRIFNEYPLAPEEEDIGELAERIVQLQQSGLLQLITEEEKKGQRAQNIKGVLGSIIAVQWLEEEFDDPKLIFSIDDPVTRRWLNFAEDENRRADFLVVRFNDDGGLKLDVIEVKAVDDPDATAFSLEDENGAPTISGPAIEQLFESTETIRKLFGGQDNVTLPPRRERLRQQIYYELISSNVPGDYEEWVDRVNETFRGSAQVDVEPRLVSVEITNQSVADRRIEAVTEDAQSVHVDKLPRETIIRLISGYVAEEIGDGQEDDQDDEDNTEEIEDSHEADELDEAEDAEFEPDTDGDIESDEVDHFGDPADYTDTVEELKRILADFEIDVRDIDADKVDVGPNVIRYKIRLAPGERQQKLERRAEDIGREMALEHDPIIHRLSGTPFVAIDVPRPDRKIVRLDEYVSDLPANENITLGELPFIAGITPAGASHLADLKDAPHMLIGGTTGEGKTVFLYSLLTCLLERLGTEDVELALVDPKITEFSPFFSDLPNLVRDKVITDADEAFDLIEWILEEEMPRRTEMLSESASVNITEHNQRTEDNHLRPLVVVVDEYADLLDQLDNSDDFERNVRRIAQRARSVGIHLVIATQRPSAQIIDTDLRSNLDMRAAFRVPSDSDSQVILDENGAEELAGNGDMLFKESDQMTRLQGTLVEPDDLRTFINQYT